MVLPNKMCRDTNLTLLNLLNVLFIIILTKELITVTISSLINSIFNVNTVDKIT